jgi:hypothetical protein
MNISYYMSRSTNSTMSQVEAYNTKNEAIFDEIIARDYIDHGQSAYMARLEEGLQERRMTLRIH